MPFLTNDKVVKLFLPTRLLHLSTQEPPFIGTLLNGDIQMVPWIQKMKMYVHAAYTCKNQLECHFLTNDKVVMLLLPSKLLNLYTQEPPLLGTLLNRDIQMVPSIEKLKCTFMLCTLVKINSNAIFSPTTRLSCFFFPQSFSIYLHKSLPSLVLS